MLYLIFGIAFIIVEIVFFVRYKKVLMKMAADEFDEYAKFHRDVVNKICAENRKFHSEDFLDSVIKRIKRKQLKDD